ncbi:TolC family protein [candidate division KSB1 bacterium]|nr:TolC family protein [candidate division KSB1 bacterium]
MKITIVACGLYLEIAVSLCAQPMTVEQAVSYAIINNPEVQQATAELQATKAIRWNALLPENPEFYVEYEGLRGQHIDWNHDGERKTGIIQQIDFPLSYYYQSQRQRLEIKRQAFKFAQVRLNLVCDVKTKFYEMLKLQQQIQNVDELYRLTAELQRKAEKRVELGDATAYEALKMQVELAEVDNYRSQLKQSTHLAQREFNMLLGRSAYDSVIVTGDFRFRRIVINEDSVTQLVVTNHPELQSLRLARHQKSADYTLAWFNLLPRIGVNYFQQRFPDPADSHAWGVEIGLSIPIWSLFKERGQIKAAKYQMEATQFQLASRRSVLRLEIDRAYHHMEIAAEQVTNWQTNLMPAADELVRIATRSYEEGEMAYWEVIEALRTMFRARNQYAETLFQYYQKSFELDRLAGFQDDKN